MRIPFAVLADEANVSQEGKLNLMGIFDRIAAAEFPVVHAKMVFAFRLEAEFADGGRPFSVRISMEDEDGKALFEAGGDMVAPHVPPGESATINQLMPMVGVQFPHAGLYRFVVRIGDAPPHETPLLVQPVTAATPRPN